LRIFDIVNLIETGKLGERSTNLFLGVNVPILFKLTLFPIMRFVATICKNSLHIDSIVALGILLFPEISFTISSVVVLFIFKKEYLRQQLQ